MGHGFACLFLEVWDMNMVVRENSKRSVLKAPLHSPSMDPARATSRVNWQWSWWCAKARGKADESNQWTRKIQLNRCSWSRRGAHRALQVNWCTKGTPRTAFLWLNGFQHCERWTVSCSDPPGLWQFVAIIGNNTSIFDSSIARKQCETSSGRSELHRPIHFQLHHPSFLEIWVLTVCKCKMSSFAWLRSQGVKFKGEDLRRSRERCTKVDHPSLTALPTASESFTALLGLPLPSGLHKLHPKLQPNLTQDWKYQEVQLLWSRPS